MDLAARRLGGVRLVTSEVHTGLVEASAANPPDEVGQRCRTHYAANLMSACPRSMLPVANELLLDYVHGNLHAARDHLDSAGTDILRFAGGRS